MPLSTRTARRKKKARRQDEADELLDEQDPLLSGVLTPQLQGPSADGVARLNTPRISGYGEKSAPGGHIESFDKSQYDLRTGTGVVAEDRTAIRVIASLWEEEPTNIDPSIARIASSFEPDLVPDEHISAIADDML